MLSSETAASFLETVRWNLEEACRRSGRPIEAVKLLAVTKTRPVSALEEYYRLGLRSFGENRVAEAVEKQAVLPSDVEWHLVGHLQTNKAKDCLGFSWVQSVDRLETALALEKTFAKAGQEVNILLEANTGGEESKNGVRTLDGLFRLTGALAGLPHLKVRGLMTMAPFSSEEAVVRPCFVKLRTWAETLARSFPDQDWTTLSMGMTNDFRWAVEEGSTMVRIGTALFEGFR